MVFELVEATPLIFGCFKARPQDAARRLNLQESEWITQANPNAVPTPRCQLEPL
jgi:hypothetical protein